MKRVSSTERIWVGKIAVQFKENLSGKIIRHNWLFEKRFGPKRLYFLIDYETKRVLFTAYEHKNNQQEIIEEIEQNKGELIIYLRGL